MMGITIKKRGIKFLAIIAGTGLICLGSNMAAAADYSCEAQSTWISNPNAPSEVPLGKNADFCEFYQFSWRWFLQLMSPSQNDATLRQFQNADKYPVLEATGNAIQNMVFNHNFFWFHNRPSYINWNEYISMLDIEWVRKNKKQSTMTQFKKSIDEVGGEPWVLR